MPTPGPDRPAVAILGPGAVGGCLAALLWRQGGGVTCVGTEASGAAIEREGLRLESAAAGDFIARPAAAARLEAPVDILFVAVKARALQEALSRVPPALLREGVVVPLLNGLEHMETLRGWFGRGVAAASIGGVELFRRSPVHVVQSTPSPPQVELASDGGVPEARLLGVARLLESAGVKASLLGRESQVLWGKLVRLNALACATAAAQKPVGWLRADPLWRSRLEGCLREGAAVAAACGATIDVTAALQRIDALPEGLSTSLQRDVAAGRQSELDAIAGAVVRAGRRHGRGCPVIEGLMSEIASRQPA